MSVRPIHGVLSVLTLSGVLIAGVVAAPPLAAVGAPAYADSAAIVAPATPAVQLDDENSTTKPAAIKVVVTDPGTHAGFSDEQTSLSFDIDGDGVWRPVQTYDFQNDLFTSFTLADLAAGAESYAAVDIVAGQSYKIRVIERGMLGGVSYDSAPTASQGPLLARGSIDVTYEITTTVVGDTVTFSWDLTKALNGNPPNLSYQASTGASGFWGGPGDGTVGSLTYTVGYDSSAYINLLQTFETFAVGWEASAVTGPTPAPPLTSTPAVATIGIAKVGATLTARPGTWQPAPVALAYQWNRDGVPVAGATSQTYAVTEVDGGARLTVSVTGSKAGFSSATVTSAPTPQVPGGRLSGTVPTIAGTATFGQTLTASSGMWGPGAALLTYRWARNGTPIAGATSPRYGVVAADIGARLTVTVTGTKSPYAPLSLTSAATRVIPSLPLTATPRPTILGTAALGKTLSVKAGTWAPAPVRLTYQWLRNGAPIAGATATTYRLTAADSGTSITVAVNGNRTGYTSANTVSLPVRP